jgi:hypothetical protein
MSKSPLSGAFADSSATTKKKNKKNGAILLIAGIALTSSIGGVFAANSITINGGSDIEFGQGVADTASCDAGLDATLTQAFTNNTFRVDTVVVDGISTSCSQTTIRVGLIDSSGASLDTFTIVNPSTASVTTDRSSAAVDAGDVDKVIATTE